MSSEENTTQDGSNNTASPVPIGNDSEMLLVQGLDYKSTFEQCSAALGVAALDGRFLACNIEFEQISGYTRDELLRHSLFNLLQNQGEAFKAMGDMLKSVAQHQGQKQQQELSNSQSQSSQPSQQGQSSQPSQQQQQQQQQNPQPPPPTSQQQQQQQQQQQLRA